MQIGSSKTTSFKLFMFAFNGKATNAECSTRTFAPNELGYHVENVY